MFYVRTGCKKGGCFCIFILKGWAQTVGFLKLDHSVEGRRRRRTRAIDILRDLTGPAMTALPGGGPRIPGLHALPVAPVHPAAPSILPQQPQSALREITCVTLCKVGQETVQDIVARTMDIFHMLRATQLPNGVTQNHAVYQERSNKLQEHLRQLTLLFKKLRLLYDKCGEMCGVTDVSTTELIPFVGDEPVRPSDLPNVGGLINTEYQEILEKLHQKNQELKHIMDQLRSLIWDINSMLAMRN